METSEQVLDILQGKPAEGAADENQAPETVDTPPEQETAPSTAEPETAETKEPEASEDAKPLTMKELAAKLEMPAKELYAVELGEGLTIGHLKDRMAELEKADELQTQAQVAKAETENQLMQQRRELAVMSQSLGREPTDAERKDAQNKWAAYVDHETRQTLTAIPEWSDPAVAQTEREGAAALLEQYGKSESEIANTVDHRDIKLAVDYYRLLKLVSGAGKEVKQKADQKPRRKRQRSADKRSDFVKAAKSGKMTPQDAIINILGN